MHSGPPLCEPNLGGENLEFLDHPHVHEPPQVIIEAARIADGIAKLK